MSTNQKNIGLKLESPEARQLFKSFQEAAQARTTIQQHTAANSRKPKNGINPSVTLRDILKAANENPNARTIVPSKADSAELAKIAEACRWAEEEVDNIDSSDEDLLEKIEKIAERAVAMF